MKEKIIDIEELKRMELNNLAELLENEEEEEEEPLETDKDDESEEDEEDEKKVNESSFDRVFGSLELNESDVVKMKDMFNVVVSEEVASRVNKELVKINERVEVALAEQAEKQDTQISNYIDYVVESWVKENEVAIVDAAKVELAESFMTSLKKVFADHEVILREDEELDAIAQAKAETKKVKEELNEAIAKLRASRETIFGLQVRSIVDELSEGLSEIQRDKFANIIGELSVDVNEGVESVKNRLSYMKEMFISNQPKADDSIDIEESVEEVEEKHDEPEAKKPKVDEKMASYMSAINRSFSTLNR